MAEVRLELMVGIPDDMVETFTRYVGEGAEEWVAHIKSRLPIIKAAHESKSAEEAAEAFRELPIADQVRLLEQVRLKEGNAVVSRK